MRRNRREVTEGKIAVPGEEAVISEGELAQCMSVKQGMQGTNKLSSSTACRPLGRAEYNKDGRIIYDIRPFTLLGIVHSGGKSDGPAHSIPLSSTAASDEAEATSVGPWTSSNVQRKAATSSGASHVSHIPHACDGTTARTEDSRRGHR